MCAVARYNDISSKEDHGVAAARFPKQDFINIKKVNVT